MPVAKDIFSVVRVLRCSKRLRRDVAAEVRAAENGFSQLASLMPASVLIAGRYFTDFTKIRTPVPSGYFGASFMILTIGCGSLAAAAACIAFSPRMNAARKAFWRGPSQTMVRALRFNRRLQPALTE